MKHESLSHDESKRETKSILVLRKAAEKMIFQM